MIDARVLINLAKKTNIRAETLEKDYVMNLILDAFCHCPSTRDTVFFKGGCCVHKCFSNFESQEKIEKGQLDAYFTTGRFSSDIDITVKPILMDEDKLKSAFAEVAEYLEGRHGLVIDQFKMPIYVDEKQNKTNCRGNIHFKGPLYMASPKKGTFNSPLLKFDITADERVLFEPFKRPIYSPYCNRGEELVLVSRTYTLRDLFSEKLRAFYDRCSPRDLYDLHVLIAHPDILKTDRKLGIGLSIMEKFKFKNMPVILTEEELERPRSNIRNSKATSLKEACKENWDASLCRQVITTPQFKDYWDNEKFPAILGFARECVGLAKEHLQTLVKTGDIGTTNLSFLLNNSKGRSQ